jgi:LAO/AO transport system kinase
MRDLVTDPDIFIRSMASRGHPGGVAHATRDVVTVLDAVGFPVVLVETVGAGQAQVEVARVANTVVLVEAPGMGDDIQALKAGLMEIADIIVVNKADRPEASQTLRALRSVLKGGGARGHHGPDGSVEAAQAQGWEVPILQTSALEGSGVSALADMLERHRRYLETSGRWEARLQEHARAEVEAWLQRHLMLRLEAQVGAEQIEAQVDRVLRREVDPATAAARLLKEMLDDDA